MLSRLAARALPLLLLLPLAACGDDTPCEGSACDPTPTDTPACEVDCPTPTPEGPVRFVAAGTSHSIAVLKDNTVWGWGSNQYGQLGRETLDSRAHPDPEEIPWEGGEVVKLASYGHTTYLLTAEGEMWGWGANGSGELALPREIDGEDASIITTPVKIEGIPDDIIDIACGRNHALAVDSLGRVWSWGSNSARQIQPQSEIEQFRTPTRVEDVPAILHLGAGASSSFLLDDRGVIWAAGANSVGQLGLGHTSSVGSFREVEGLSGVTKVEGNGPSTMALLDTGALYAWGSNEWGALADAFEDDADEPWLIRDLNCDDISVGYQSFFCLAETGSLFGWGANEGGTLAMPASEEITYSPMRLEGLPAIGRLTSYAHVLAPSVGGVLFRWGYNTYGKSGEHENDSEVNADGAPYTLPKPLDSFPSD